MMKNNKDIEKQLTRLKKHYQVPENYFENLKFEPQTKKSQFKIHSFSKKWMIAAGLLVLISLGYRVFLWQQNKNTTQNIIPDQTEISSHQTDNLDDLTDDDIIEYLLDNDVSYDEL
jgi:hypothetical protein